MGMSLRDLPRGITGQALPDSEFQFLKPEPEPTPSYYIETYVCILLNLLLCMSPRYVILFSSSISAWAICTFFWVPYLNYWHNYQANSPSQKCGRHRKHSSLFSITNSYEFYLLNYWRIKRSRNVWLPLSSFIKGPPSRLQINFLPYLTSRISFPAVLVLFIVFHDSPLY